MRKVVLFPVPALLVLMAMGCQPPAQEMAPIRTAEQAQADMEAMRATWVDMANTGDAGGMAAIYAEDVLYTDPYGGVHQGRAAVEEYYRQALVRSSGWDLKMDGTVFHGNMVAGYGTWSATQSTPEGAMPIGGRWQNVTVYEADGSPKVRLSFAMMPAPMPEM